MSQPFFAKLANKRMLLKPLGAASIEEKTIGNEKN